MVSWTARPSHPRRAAATVRQRRPCAPMPLRRAARHAAATRVTYTISDLAREFALTTRAIRFYEDAGLRAPRAQRPRARLRRARARAHQAHPARQAARACRCPRSASSSTCTRWRATSARSSRSSSTLLADRRARLLQQKEDIDAVLAEIDGIERECRRRLQGRAQAPPRARRRRRPRGGDRRHGN